MSNGYTVQGGMEAAFTTLRSEQPAGQYFGANSYRIVGNAYYCVNHN